MEHVRRIIASPYAKRLARERGLDLASLLGSGPNGRIVAADLPDEPAPAASVSTEADATESLGQTAAPIAQPAAFAVSLDLRPAAGLLQELGDAGLVFDMDDIVLRAVTRSFGAAFGEDASLTLEVAGTRRQMADAQCLTLSALREFRLREPHDNARGQEGIVCLHFMEGDGIRPVMLPLTRGHPMRVVVALGRACTAAECLLVFDPLAVDEKRAMSLLDAIRRSLEAPLSLLA